MTLIDLLFSSLKGGAGSGNFGHGGRIGKRGGSVALSSGGAITPSGNFTQKTEIKKDRHSWGVRRSVEFGEGGMSGKAVIHPEDFNKISSLKKGQSLKYTDEQRIEWKVSRPKDSHYMFEAEGSYGGLGYVKVLDLK